MEYVSKQRVIHDADPLRADSLIPRREEGSR